MRAECHTSGPMATKWRFGTVRRPRCACQDPDRWTCAELREGGGWFDLLHPRHDAEPCDCCCHREDEDGHCPWDDDEPDGTTREAKTCG